jgi:hypothetical protein
VRSHHRPAKPIAAVREYMDEKRWREAEAQVPQVAQVLEAAAAQQRGRGL